MESYEKRREDWRKAEADFNNWPIVGKTADGSIIRRDPDPFGWGDGVYEEQTGMVISPVAYSVRQEISRKSR